MQRHLIRKCSWRVPSMDGIKFFVHQLGSKSNWAVRGGKMHLHCHYTLNEASVIFIHLPWTLVNERSDRYLHPFTMDVGL